MLQVEIRALDSGPVETAGTYSAPDLGFDGPESLIRGPVEVEGRLSNAGSGQYFWRGKVEAKARLECRRCLCNVDYAVAVPVDVLFVEHGEAEDNDVYVLAQDTPMVDLTGMLHEELVLATPEWVLCKEDCRGLCAGCGTDLNLGSCTCAPVTDPRWAALEALKTDSTEEGS